MVVDAAEENHHANEAQKSLQQEKYSRAKDQRDHDG